MKEQTNQEQKNDENNHQLSSLVDLISKNLNNNVESNENKDKSSSSIIINDNQNKKDDLLSEIDNIIGKDTLDNMLKVYPLNNSKETLSLTYEKKNKIDISDNHFSNSYISKENYDFMNEPIIKSIYRDLSSIYIKLKFVINPFISNEEKMYYIKNWDLWGPLLLTILLSAFLAFNSLYKSKTITLIFIIFWLGSFLVFINARLLGVNISIFQIFCLLGYCLFPLVFTAFLLVFKRFDDIIRGILVGATCSWSLYSASSILKGITAQDKRYLVLYPSILLYIYISWFIFVN